MKKILKKTKTNQSRLENHDTSFVSIFLKKSLLLSGTTGKIFDNSDLFLSPSIPLGVFCHFKFWSREKLSVSMIFFCFLEKRQQASSSLLFIESEYRKSNDTFSKQILRIFSIHGRGPIGFKMYWVTTNLVSKKSPTCMSSTSTIHTYFPVHTLATMITNSSIIIEYVLSTFCKQRECLLSSSDSALNTIWNDILLLTWQSLCHGDHLETNYWIWNAILEE